MQACGCAAHSIGRNEGLLRAASSRAGSHRAFAGSRSEAASVTEASSGTEGSFLARFSRLTSCCKSCFCFIAALCARFCSSAACAFGLGVVGVLSPPCCLLCVLAVLARFPPPSSSEPPSDGDSCCDDARLRFGASSRSSFAFFAFASFSAYAFAACSAFAFTYEQLAASDWVTCVSNRGAHVCAARACTWHVAPTCASLEAGRFSFSFARASAFDDALSISPGFAQGQFDLRCPWPSRPICLQMLHCFLVFLPPRFLPAEATVSLRASAQRRAHCNDLHAHG